MANTHMNTGAGFSGAPHSTSGGTAASIHPATEKPQNRTMLWVVGGVLLLSLIIWFATSTNDRAGYDNMERGNTGQQAPAPNRR